MVARKRRWAAPGGDVSSLLSDATGFAHPPGGGHPALAAGRPGSAAAAAAPHPRVWQQLDAEYGTDAAVTAAISGAPVAGGGVVRYLHQVLDAAAGGRARPSKLSTYLDRATLRRPQPQVAAAVTVLTALERHKPSSRDQYDVGR